MAESNIIKTKRDTVTTHSDATPTTALTYTVSLDPGDFSYAVGNSAADFLDHGRLVGAVRFGDDVAITGSYSANFRDTTDAAVATLFDILNASGYVGATWVSTLGADAEVFTTDILHTIEGTDHGDGADHTILIPDCSTDYNYADGDPNSTSINFRSHTATKPTLT